MNDGCCFRVYKTGNLSLGSRCQRPGKYEYRGEWYCAQHHPVMRKEREAKRPKFRRCQYTNVPAEGRLCAHCKHIASFDSFSKLREENARMREALEEIAGHTPFIEWDRKLRDIARAALAPMVKESE